MDDKKIRYINRIARDNAVAEVIAIHYSEFTDLYHRHRMKLIMECDNE